MNSVIMLAAMTCGADIGSPIPMGPAVPESVFVAPVVAPKPLPATPVVTYAPLPVPSCRWVWTGRGWVQVCPR